jgi:hypothetical protein
MFAHMFGKDLATQEDATHVDLNDLVELFGADVLGGGPFGIAGIVDDDVDPPPCSGNPVAGREEILLAANIEWDRDCGRSRRIE